MALLKRYSLALGMAALALLVRAALGSGQGDQFQYTMLYPAVAFTAWAAGRGPAVATTLVGAFGTLYWFVPPLGTLHFRNPKDPLGLLLFLVVSWIIIVLLDRARQTAARLRQAERHLESKVAVRASQLTEANQRLSDLSHRILDLQDEERRRVARELHDGVGQLLAALKMNQDRMRREGNISPGFHSLMLDNEDLIDRALKEVRTVSHLLHPPLLEDLGLRAALERLVTGYAERSEIAVRLDFRVHIERLPGELELGIFRVVQECLTNIHKHSQAKAATVRIDSAEGNLVVIVRDDGTGMPEEKAKGIGLRGMRERARHLGGELHIESSRAGTTVLAVFPERKEFAAAGLP